MHACMCIHVEARGWHVSYSFVLTLISKTHFSLLCLCVFAHVEVRGQLDLPWVWVLVARLVRRHLYPVSHVLVTFHCCEETPWRATIKKAFNWGLAYCSKAQSIIITVRSMVSGRTLEKALRTTASSTGRERQPGPGMGFWNLRAHKATPPNPSNPFTQWYLLTKHSDLWVYGSILFQTTTAIYLLFLCVCLSTNTPTACIVWRWDQGIVVTGVCMLPCWCWEPNSVLLQELQVLLTSDPSLLLPHFLRQSILWTWNSVIWLDRLTAILDLLLFSLLRYWFVAVHWCASPLLRLRALISGSMPRWQAPYQTTRLHSSPAHSCTLMLEHGRLLFKVK